VITSSACNIGLSTGWGLEMSNVTLLNGGQLRQVSLAQAESAEDLADRIICRLRDLQNEIQRAKNVRSIGLDSAHDEVSSLAVPAHSNESMDTNLQMDVRRARSLRQLRKRIFGKDNFSGPAWDILLHLFESHVSQLRDTVGNVCDGTELPSATAVRWIGRLEQELLVSVSDDQFDGRRRFVKLTDSGVQLMINYFAGAAPHRVAA
jgi:DNA-binding MarR family transcriptional regulator